MAESVSTLATLRIGTIIIALLLCFAGGVGATATAFKLWGSSLAGVFDLPRASDARIEMLDSHRADLHVEEVNGKTVVFVDGDVRAISGQTKDGLSYLYFKNQ